MNLSTNAARCLATAALTIAAVLAVAGGAALGGTNRVHRLTDAGPLVPDGFSVTLFAAAPTGLTNPDDLTRLNGDLFVSYQNNANADGTPAGAYSTVVEYSHGGDIVNQWNLIGRCDGLTADPQSHQILATINEDAHSSLAVIRPNADSAGQVRLLTYSPDPANVSGGGSGGGTDALTILDGAIYVSASNPTDTTVPALYRLAVPRHGSTAFLAPVFADDAQAIQGNAGSSGTTTLALTDPDSNTTVPRSSPRFADDLMLDSQGDSQLVFAGQVGTPEQQLTLLNLGGPMVDDVRWAATNGGDLYVVDQKSGEIWRISGAFPAGAAYASIPSGSPMAGEIGRIDLGTGSITPFATGLVSPKGLLYVGNDNGNDNGNEQ